MLSLDTTTRAEYDAATTASARSQAILDALGSSVTVNVYDGSATLMGTGTMQAPWAIRSGAVLTVGEVGSFSVGTSGTPDANWYLRFEGASRWVRGSFGLTGSGSDFTWSLPTWEAGQGGSLGTVTARTSADTVETDLDAVYSLQSGGTVITFGWSVPENYPITLPNSGANYDLAQHLTRPAGVTPTYSLAVPISGVTVGATSGLLTVAAGVAAGDHYPIVIADDNVVATNIATVTVVGGGAGIPWTAGHAFRQGDVRADQYIAGSGTFQALVRNRWSDGSVKFAVLSGVGQTSVVLQAASGEALGGEVALTNPQASVTFTGAITGTYPCPVVNTEGTWDRGLAHLVRKIAGPVMTERHYFVPTTDAHVAVWFYVRSYNNGSTEVETVVENGWVNVAGPTEKTYTATVVVNGTQRYSGTLTHGHHQRWSRRDWVSGTAGVARHDTAYLRATKLVPNYGWATATSETAFGFGAYGASARTVASVTDAEAQGDFPLALGMFRSAQSAGGEDLNDQLGLMPFWDALYVRTGDIRALRAVEWNGRCAGLFPVHYRDENTGRLPRTNASTVYYDGGTGTTPPPSGVEAGIDREHQPLTAYMAYLCTGRYPFLEQVQMQALWNFFQAPTSAPWPASTDVGRDGTRGLMRLGTTRAVAWPLRTLAAAAAVSTGDVATDLTFAWGENMDWLWSMQTDIVTAGGTMKNNLGVVWANRTDTFGTTRIGPWQHGFLTCAIAWGWDLDVCPAGKRTSHQSIRDHAYKVALEHCGYTHNGTGYSWRRCGTYYEPIGTPGATAVAGGTMPASFYSSWREIYNVNLARAGASDLDDASPATQGIIVSPENEGGFDAPGTEWALPPATNWATTCAQKPLTRALCGPLAFAADHQITGARAAYDLVFTSKSFVDPTSNQRMADAPRYVITPR